MNIALILAGGRGSRLGGEIPKQYLEVGHKPIIAYCLETFVKHREIHYIQIVAETQWHSLIKEWTDVISNSGSGSGQEPNSKLQGFSIPGETRQLSVWNGLRDVWGFAGEEDVVIVHDAARPLVSERIITDCLEACKKHEGALTALPVKDTVYYCVDGKVESLLERDRLIAGQAPEAFRVGSYYRANEKLLPDKILQINGSTEPAVLAGMDICLVDGDERNFKITTGEDLVRFQQILQLQEV